jgi:sulfur carrier protein
LRWCLCTGGFSILLPGRRGDGGLWVPYNVRMVVKVNGDEREVGEGETVRALIERYGLSPEKVAVELNRRLLRGERYDTALKEGDEVEIVTFVGGG